jgi:hypothetical protein
MGDLVEQGRALFGVRPGLVVANVADLSERGLLYYFWVGLIGIDTE